MKNVFEREYKKRVPQEVYDRMMTAINRCVTSHEHGVMGYDWLRYNPSMKLAARAAGIKTSKELRNLYAV